MANEDICPALVAGVRKQFQKNCLKNVTMRRLSEKLGDGTATYSDAYRYAEEVGEARAEAFKSVISSDVLPDGKMYYNIASRLVPDSLTMDHNIVASYSEQVQQILNEKTIETSLIAQRADLNEDRIDGFVQRLASENKYDDVAWLLDEPVVTHARSVVDDTIKKNAEYQHKAGLKATVIRVAAAGCCKWCSGIAGDYVYPGVPREVFQRHDNCSCTVEYEGKKLSAYESNNRSHSFRDLGESRTTDTNTTWTNATATSEVSKLLAKSNIQYKPVRDLSRPLTEDEIIAKIAGGDKTKGSCSSLTYCYIGNKCGYDVTDFRGGDSQLFFARKGNSALISKLDGIDDKVYIVNKEASEVAKKLKELNLPYGKEYRLSCGRHAAIIRNTESGYQYLELQSPDKNGWMSFYEKEKLKATGIVDGKFQYETITEKCSMYDTLKRRFGCTVSENNTPIMRDGKLLTDQDGRLILGSEMRITSVDSYKGNSEFKNILGYINTDSDKQLKGDDGYAK